MLAQMGCVAFQYDMVGYGDDTKITHKEGFLDVESTLRIWDGEMDALPLETDVVIHLAWYAVPGKYLTAPENRDCLEASRRLLSNVRGRAVFIGTCFEHDLRLGVLREDSPTRPTTLYAECKDTLRREVEVRPNSAWVRLRGKPSRMKP